MSESLAWAVLLGSGLGLGLWSIVAVVPRLSRPRLIDRVAPYLLDVSPAAREHVRRRTVDPLPLLGSLSAPLLIGVRSVFSRLLGGSEPTATRLRQAGATESVERFRMEQLVWALVGGALGLAVGILGVSAGSLPAAATLAVPLLGTAAGAVARDALLRRRARRRLEQLRDELPTVLEFLTLSLSAGEGILDALRRVAQTSRGELAAEFSTAITRVGAGVPLTVALSELSTGLRLPALSRAVDQLVGALERGTPLAAVLRAQAQDARADAKNRLLETAGRKEVAMLVPLVFLILPLTVVIAIFPGLFVLQAGF